MATRTLYGFDEDGNKIAVGSYNDAPRITLPSDMTISENCYIQVDGGEQVVGSTWATANAGKTINADTIKFIGKNLGSAYPHYIAFENGPTARVIFAESRIVSDVNFNYEIEGYYGSITTGSSNMITDYIENTSGHPYCRYILLSFTGNTTFSRLTIQTKLIGGGSIN